MFSNFVRCLEVFKICQNITVNIKEGEIGYMMHNSIQKLLTWEKSKKCELRNIEVETEKGAKNVAVRQAFVVAIKTVLDQCARV